MRLKYTFETMDLDDWKIAVPVGDAVQNFSGVIKLNGSAAEIFGLLQQETTEESIVAELKKKYDNDQDITGYVHEAIEYFRNEGVLE